MKSANKSWAPILVPGGIGITIVVASLVSLSIQRDAQRERLAFETRKVGSTFAARLETHLATRLNAGRLLGQRFLNRKELDAEYFQSETAPLHELFGDFQALNWVDADGVIRIVTPGDGNAAALGLDLHDLELPSAALTRAEESGRMQITPPLELAQGGLGFVAYLPITVNAERRGFLNIVFRAEPLIRNALGENMDRSYHFGVQDGGNLLFSSANSAAPSVEFEASSISVGDREWQLQVSPTSARIASASTLFDEFFFVVGLLFAALTSSLSHLVINRQISFRESQSRLQDFASASSDWFWEMDDSLRVTWISEGIEDSFGVPPADFLGLKRGDIRDPVDNDDAWEHHLADLEARRPFRDFVYATLVEGDRKWVRVSGAPRFDDSGKFLGYRGTATDHTELVRSRDAVGRANARLADAVESLNDVFSLWDQDDRLVFGNRVFRELNKDIPDVLVPGTPFAEYLRAGICKGHMRDLNGREEEFLAQSLERRYDPNAEAFEIERTDGVVLRLSEQKLDSGGYVTIGQDVTRERQSESALRASQERLALAVRQLSIWDWNIEKNELYVSPGFAEILGYSQAEFNRITRQSAISLLHPDDIERFRKRMAEHLKHGTKPFSNEQRVRTKSGDYRWFLAIGQSTADKTGKAVRSTGVLTDISERVELENRLQQAQKMEAIGNLTGGVAHDFNNLLAVILGNLELIQNSESAEELSEFVDAAIQATQRGADLVKSMLSFSQKSRLELAIINLNELVDETHYWFARVMPENIDLRISLADEPWAVEVDRALAQNAILNLLLNARDAMPNGGDLTMETSNLSVEEEMADAQGELLSAGEYVVLSVSDTGEGIPEAHLDKIFQPYFTTKPTGAGSGLGLSMVQGFMKQSGGTVCVLSEPAKGTRIQLFFPAKAVPAPASLDTTKFGVPNVEREARILLVEDESEVLKVVEAVLSHAGYQVRTAVSGDEALEIWNKDGEFDLLMTDIVMPGSLQGTQLAEKLRQTDPRLPIILLSGYSNQGAERDDKGARGIHRLMKPVRNSDLINAVEQALLCDP